MLKREGSGVFKAILKHMRHFDSVELTSWQNIKHGRESRHIFAYQ